MLLKQPEKGFKSMHSYENSKESRETSSLLDGHYLETMCDSTDLSGSVWQPPPSQVLQAELVYSDLEQNQQNCQGIFYGLVANVNQSTNQPMNQPKLWVFFFAIDMAILISVGTLK
jgi:hypothetical protein